MKSEKEIRDKFEEVWRELYDGDGNSKIYRSGILQALNWVLDEKLLEKKIDEVIR
jgi:hypothetical protein